MSLDYKINLDTGSLTKGAQAVNSVNLAMGALTSLMRGNFIVAATQARGAWIALQGALLANPFIAIATALFSVGAALASVAWKRHQSDVEALSKATDDLAAATERYNKTVQDISFKNAGPSGRMKILQEERSALDYQLYKQTVTPGRDPAEETARQAEIKRLEEQLAIKDDQIREVRAAMVEAAAKESAQNRANQAAQDKKLADMGTTRIGLTQTLLEGRADYSPEQKARDLKAEIVKLEEEHASIRFDVVRKSEIENELLKKEIELQRTRNQINAEQKSKAEQAAGKLSSIKGQEAEYAFGKLTPRQQLFGINDRAREIMGKKGWDQDAEARAELLDLRKRRDAANEKLKDEKLKDEKKKPSRSVSSRELSMDEVIDLDQARERSNQVIRMRGSRAGGFLDEDGVQRMRGSLAGGFGSRLRSSAFSRTSEELEAKRLGLTGREIVTGGDEQPVEIKGEAVGLLRKMAAALEKDS